MCVTRLTFLFVFMFFGAESNHYHTCSSVVSLSNLSGFSLEPFQQLFKIAPVLHFYVVFNLFELIYPILI